MSNVTKENQLSTLDDEQDKDFNQWRQPKPPESPKTPEELKSNSPEQSVQNTSVCSVKDLSRLTRKRRALLSIKGPRVTSRKRNDDKPFGFNNEAKQRTIRKGRLNFFLFTVSLCIQLYFGLQRFNL